MNCHRVKRSGKPANWLHSLFCAECRASQRTDDLLAFGIVQLRKPAHAHMALNRTLDALNLAPIAETYYLRRSRRRRISIRAATASVALLGVGSWVNYMDWVPAEPAIPAWEKPSPSYIALRDAVETEISSPSSMTDTNKILIAIKRLEEHKESSPIPDMAIVGNYVSANSETLKMIHANKFLPYREQMDRTLNGSSYPYPYLTLYTGSAMLQAELAWKVAQGDRAEAINDALDMIDFGENTAGGGSQAARVYGIQCQQNGRLLLWRLLHSMTADEAHQACARLEEARKYYTPVNETIRWERESDLFIQRSMLRSPFWRWGFAESIARSKGGVLPLAERLTTAFKLYARSNRRILQERTHAWDVAESHPPHYGQNAFENAVPDKRDLIDQGLIPDQSQFYTMMRFMFTESEAQNALLTTALAIQAYHAEHGANPKSLQALCPTYMKQVPTDPFLSGSPLHYAPEVAHFLSLQKASFAPGMTVKDRSVTYPTYLLYSVGPDLTDQKGAFILPIIRYGARSFSENIRVRQESVGDIVAGVNL